MRRDPGCGGRHRGPAVPMARDPGDCEAARAAARVARQMRPAAGDVARGPIAVIGPQLVAQRVGEVGPGPVRAPAERLGDADPGQFLDHPAVEPHAEQGAPVGRVMLVRRPAVGRDVVEHRADPEVAEGIGPAVIEAHRRVSREPEAVLPPPVLRGPPPDQPGRQGHEQAAGFARQGQRRRRLLEGPGREAAFGPDQAVDEEAVDVHPVDGALLGAPDGPLAAAVAHEGDGAWKGRRRSAQGIGSPRDRRRVAGPASIPRAGPDIPRNRRPIPPSPAATGTGSDDRASKLPGRNAGRGLDAFHAAA